MSWEGKNIPKEKAVVLLPDGSVKTLRTGASFVNTIKKIAKDIGLAKFRVFVGDKEILQTKNAPTKIKKGARISITPYDKAA